MEHGSVQWLLHFCYDMLYWLHIYCVFNWSILQGRSIGTPLPGLIDSAYNSMHDAQHTICFIYASCMQEDIFIDCFIGAAWYKCVHMTVCAHAFLQQGNWTYCYFLTDTDLSFTVVETLLSCLLQTKKKHSFYLTHSAATVILKWPGWNDCWNDSVPNLLPWKLEFGWPAFPNLVGADTDVVWVDISCARKG